MDDYDQPSENNTQKGNFFYATPVLVPHHKSPTTYGRGSSGSNVSNNNTTQMAITSFHLLQSSECYNDNNNNNPEVAVKTEAGTSQHAQKFQNYNIHRGISQAVHHQQQQEGSPHESSSEVEAVKAKIIQHPQYSNVLEAYIDCQKVGAPAEIVARLSVAREEFEGRQRSWVNSMDSSRDPELDQFMEAYYDMLVKYRWELMRPFQEAMDFIRRIETQLNMIGTGPLRIFNSDDKCEDVCSSDEDQKTSGGEIELPEIDPCAEDRQLKNHLLRKYSGYLSSLKQELSKKKKKGKLPQEARQKLLAWWELHYKWPYPSESEKMALAESTGLDQKQINNWFINQRKRHWKPSEDMQFMVMDGPYPQNAALYMDAHYMGDGPYYHLGQ